MDTELLSFDNVVVFQRSTPHDACKHEKVILNQQLATVECQDCGEKLEPIAWMSGYLKELRNWRARVNRNLAKAQVIEEKISKTGVYACQHCHEISRINVSALASRTAVELRMKVLDEGSE